MVERYKDYHIKLMHSNGTTAYETILVILPVPLYTFITVVLVSLLVANINSTKKWQFIFELFVLVFPVILNVTIFSEYIKDFIFASLFILVNLLLLIYNLRESKTRDEYNAFKTHFLTNARSTINMLSVIAILAVDFKIFPRCFAKTEFFGYSVMDVGVGLFMYSNGIIAPEARGHRDSIKKSIKSSLPLFILGGARIIFVKQTDYNVPISEYGIHWNFFITLGVTKIFSSFILNIIQVKYILINATFIVIAHEGLLQSGLQEFGLLNNKRDTFIKANKEGLVSCLGYICIYLFSVYFGYLLNIKKLNKNSIAWKFCMGALITLSISLILQSNFGISRRLANSAYCFWILFIGIFMTGLFYLGQVIQTFICRGKLDYCIYSPLIFEAINYNGLVFFLVGNILTGLINISLNTLTISPVLSLIILVLYMCVNCFIVVILYHNQIKVKL